MADIQAQTPDGMIHSFPDGTAPEVVDGAIKRYLSSKNSQQQQQAPPEKSFLQKVRDVQPEGFIRRGLESVSEWAGKKQQETYQVDEAAAARGENAGGKFSFKGAGLGMLSSAAKTGAGLVQPSMKDAAIIAAGVMAPEIVGPAMVGHGLFTAAKNAPKAIKGNPEAVEAALSGGAEAAFGGAASGAALGPGTPKTATGNLMRAGYRTIVKGEAPKVLTPSAQKAMTQAIQPGVNVPKGQQSIAAGGPRIQQLLRDGGLQDLEGQPLTRIDSAGDLLAASRGMKRNALSAIQERMGPVKELQPDTSNIGDAMEKTITKRMERQAPKVAEQIRKQADDWRNGGYTLADLEDSIVEMNDELKPYYKQATAGENSLAPSGRATLAAVKAARQLLDEKIEALTGEGIKDLKREYGAARDIEKGAARQYAIETRTKEGGLWEGLAYLHAAGDLVTGNLLKAGATLTVGRWLKNLRSPSKLIETSFHGPKAFEAAEPIAPHAGPPEPKGLLSKPATEAGFTEEDTSGTNRGQSGRWTTPAGQLPEPAPIEAEFIPRRVETQTPRIPLSRWLTSGEKPPSSRPPAVQPEYTREAISPDDETKLGRTGEGGVRIAERRLLPDKAEESSTKKLFKAAQGYKPSEKAATMSAPGRNHGPEFDAQELQEEINRNKSILRNPKATAEEKSIAEDRLRDAEKKSEDERAIQRIKKLFRTAGKGR